MRASVEGRTTAAAAVLEFRVGVAGLLIKAVLVMDLCGDEILLFEAAAVSGVVVREAEAGAEIIAPAAADAGAEATAEAAAIEGGFQREGSIIEADVRRKKSSGPIGRVGAVNNTEGGGGEGGGGCLQHWWLDGLGRRG